MDSPGCLDGKTLLRFAHEYYVVGGVSFHLQALNKHLLLRNEMTIIQIFVTGLTSDAEEITEYIGKGKLVKIPVISVKRRISREIHNGSTLGRLLFRKGILNSGVKCIFKMISQNPLLASFFRILTKHAASSRNAVFTENYLEIAEIVQRVFAHFDIDIVVAHSRRLEWLSIFISEAEKAQIPILVQNHGNNDRLKEDGDSAIVEKVTGFGGVTDIGVPQEFRQKFTPMYNGIDLDFFDPDSAACGPYLDQHAFPIIILYPARISEMKGQIDFIQVVKSLVDQKFDIRLIFAGGHESSIYLDDLKRTIATQGLQNIVDFPGALSQEQLRDMYAKSDVVVLPSKTEGLPRVLLEAQAMKKPVVAYNVGGVCHAFINGETGFLVSPDDRRDFAEKLKALLLDKAKRKVMGENARKHAEKFGLPALAARHEQWYLNALAAN